jgi:Zn-dependent protease
MALLNFILAFFNLIPIGVLDGHHIMENALPYPTSEEYRQFNHNYGMAILLGLIGVQFFLGIPVLSVVIFTPARFLSTLAAGVDPAYYIAGSGLLMGR